ncbi:MAG TPA: V-type ATP synthase subunit E family protein [Ruminiclostridium sp.]|nr:V-type ATP synthase subunit E family protein [Ruminiclostridium sp.]
MSQSEKKLENFSSAVLKDAEEQRSKILAEIEEYRKRELEKAEEEILHDAYVMIQNEIASIKNKHSRKISLAELEGRRNQLVLRDQLTNKVFEESAALIIDFTKSEGYKQYMLDLVKKSCSEIPEGNIVISVKKDDIALSSELAAASGRDAKVEANAAIKLGGILVSNPEKGIVVDETLDLKLSSQKDWFTSVSGLSISM